jgi:cytochrome o ubiquinol oxidase subunit 3
MNEHTVVHEQEDSKTLFGFWIYIMTDCVLFGSLFATFAVLRNNTFGGPSGQALFSLPFVLAETLILLTSSFTCGLGMLAVHKKRKNLVLAMFGLTFLLGATFLGLELQEFHKLATEGSSWRRSGFLSAFFTLVGTHGLHITVGLVWMVTLMTRLDRHGFRPSTIKRFTMLSLFWHFLDIVWIFIFSIVYMLGVI